MNETERKNFTVKGYSRKLKAQRLNDWTDQNGNLWQCWTPTGITLSAWVRIEPIKEQNKHKRTQFVYDPSGSLRRQIQAA